MKKSNTSSKHKDKSKRIQINGGRKKERKIDIIINSILQIEKSKNSLDLVKIPINLSNKFRKNTKKRSSYASNKIEGNTLTYEQADAAIEAKNRA